MNIRLIKSVEHWQESSAVQSAIETAEQQAGYASDSYDEYTAEIADLRNRVGDRLIDQGHSVEWSHSQSVGMGCLLQGPWVVGRDDALRAQADYAVDSAIEYCLPRFIENCVGRARTMQEVE